jgi:SAM-dependent methyltransferase
LDIGCSDGTFLSRAWERGNEVQGIDIDERALEIARSRGIAASRQEIAEFVAAAEATGKTFDFITAFDVIEHLTDPVAEIARLARLLAPGGHLVGTVPNKNRLLANEMAIDFPPHHFFRFDENGLRTTVQAAGLKVERLEVFQYNYVAQTALNMLLKRARLRADSTSTQGDAPKSGASSAGGRRRPIRLLKGLVSRSLQAVSTPISYAVELPGKRGFKLLFVATR